MTASTGSANPRCFAVAYSGGRDSTALLHATLAPAAELGLQVHALHVHHGLVEQADAWLAHAERQCRRWTSAGAALSFHAHRLAGAPPRGESVEAWARRERYAALAAMARRCGAALVLLGHHRRDQAETFLLQALRGAGASGLASMPREAVRGGIVWARPWLDQPREAIDAYLEHHRLSAVDDPSNEQARFARSRLRAQVWPALQRAFPDAEASLAGAARRAQATREALDGFTAAALEPLRDADALRVDGWLALPAAQREFVLRAWLGETIGRGAAHALVERLLRELPAARSARWRVGEGVELRRYRGRLALHGAATPRGGRPAVVTLDLSCAGTHEVPAWHGALRVTPVESGGVALSTLRDCELRARTGSERFQAGPNRPPRSLKKQFQAAGVAPWLRDAPLLYCRGRLVFVPWLGVDANALAQTGEPQVQLEWLADGPT